MTLDNLIAGIAAVVILAYLVYAMLRPDKI
ncbi:MAG TPA: potassium-transporting ATPase subunit F [Gemmatimonadaceae bacterium]